MMFAALIVKKSSVIKSLAIAGAAILLVVNVMQLRGIQLLKINTTGMLFFDQYALVFTSVLLAVLLLFFILNNAEIEKIGNNLAEYYALIFFIMCGVILVASFKSLLILFLGIEIISIPLYILTGSDKRNLKSNEASLKYFLMGSFSTGIMLMGIALLYGATGTFAVDKMVFLTEKPAVIPVAGMLLLLFSLAFKVSAAPFHFWTPDVYDGAPTPFTGFMSTIVKAAFFIGFIRLFAGGLLPLEKSWSLWIAVIVAVTLLIANLTATFQQSAKRMLAYSSIAQAGFMLLAVLGYKMGGFEAMVYYGAAYCLASVGIFAVLAKLDDYSFEGFNGLAKQQPLVALFVTICILSLAGIPLTAGFLAKFYVIKATILTGGCTWLVIFALIMAAVSVYYYFKIIQAMYFKTGNANLAASNTFKIALAIIAVLIILLGMYPQLLLYWLYF